MTEPQGSSSGSGGAASPEVIAALAYVGGFISGVVVLMVEKQDKFVRFHAMQSVVTFLGVLVAHLLFSSIPVVGTVLYIPFIAAIVFLWGFLMYQAGMGRAYKLPYIGEFAEQQLR